MELSKEERAVIEKMRKQKGIEDAKQFQPKTAQEYTVEEKCVIFDGFHAAAMEHWEKVKAEKWTDEDDRYYIYESVINLLGKGIWAAIRKIQC